MKSMAKSVFLMAILFLCVSAYAQADRIVVGGKTPLLASQVEAVIEFYEWAFGTKFTPDERRRSEELTVEYHKQDPERSASENETIVRALANVRSKDAATQAEMRNSFVKGFVDNLRKVDNPSTQLLLPIYERGRPGSSPAASTSKTGSVGGPIVGRWILRGGSGGARDFTGKTLYNNSNDVTFEFRADGTARFLHEKRTLSIMQCKMSETTDVAGRYTVSGGTVTIDFAAGKNVSTSSCEAARNYTKTIPAERMTKQFVVKNFESIVRPDAPVILCFDGADGDKCFEKEKPPTS